MRANLEALAALRTIESEARPATPDEQAALARWSGWGAVPQVFDPARGEYSEAREQLTGLLSPQEYAAARRSTLNAHYTDAELVAAVWEGLGQLGFDGGRVLEPGCGSGNFIGLAPAGADLTGVEQEPLTAAIARALYPDARILTESFADTRIPDGGVDAVVGNVPFGDIVLHDPTHNAAKHSIHNHFLLKSIRATRPGGMVAALTSHYTMDARNPAARREMASLADLVAAVRLPGGAHQRAAGTGVVTDLLVLRRREAGADPDAGSWERVRPVTVDGQALEVNEYFLNNPAAVLGELGAGRGPYSRAELQVRAGGDTPGALRATLTRVAGEAHASGLGMTAPGERAEETAPAAVGGQAERFEGYIAARGDGTFTRVAAGWAETYDPPATQAEELRQLLGLRDTAVALLEAEAGSREDGPELAQLRVELRSRYDSYAQTYGPVNRFAWRRTGRTDPDTGQERLARVHPPQGGFRKDPFAATVYALEQFDPVTQHVTGADIFHRRVLAPRSPRLGADDPADAVAICLDTVGEVRLDETARLLGTADHTETRKALGTLVYDEPHTGSLIPAADYLSGEVRTKLAAARSAAETDDRFGVNVDALTEVVPPDLGPAEIDARMGATWIDPAYIQQFLTETLDDPAVRVEHPGGSLWTVRGGSRRTVAATSTWGTARMPAPDLAQHLLEQSPIRVTDEAQDADGNTRRVPNPTETIAAQEKASELGARFSDWVWDDPDRAADLARVYNDTFNGLVLRSYDDAQLSLPGLAASFAPRPHQTAAVARIVNEPTVLLGHEVGSGKTAEMIMGAMELRRLGLVAKPAMVVPNHLPEQFQREFLRTYPQARVLTCTRADLTPDRRRDFVARCATGDWDAVIVTRSAFERIPMSPAEQEAYLDREQDLLRAQLANSRGGEGLSVKRLERSLARAEQRTRAKMDTDKDPGISFEQTGVDYLFVDEAHGYKNLRTASQIPGAAIEGSGRATDLDMKLSYLRRTSGQRVATFATATPIANSMTEAYVMQRYLRPDLLEAAGLEDFDSWAAAFGEVTTDIELSPEGGSFRLSSRFAKFRNVPELLRMWHVSADIKTADDLNIPAPDVAGGGPDTVITEAPAAVAEYMTDLGDRADRVRNRQVDPGDDNMLKITGDGNAVSLHPRLRGLEPGPGEPTKVETAARRIAAIWDAHRGDTYHGPGGDADPVRGSFQLVFCDLGTPGSGWNVYDELAGQLTDRGMPRGSVRFIHDARNDREKEELFADCRAGRVAALIGSTEKMGVGTNVQDRAVAVHHLDCPWRPADIEQREGRVLRQGNRNDTARVLRYVTADSLDTYRWQTVERKARFISSVKRGRLDVREIEDIGGAALSYAEVKSLAAGDPRLMEKAQLDADLNRLERLARSWNREQTTLARGIEGNQRRIAQLTAEIDRIGAALDQRRDTHGDAFTMRVHDVTFTTRTEAGRALVALVQRRAAGSPAARSNTAGRAERLGDVADLGGFPVAAGVEAGLGAASAVLSIPDVPRSEVRLKLTELGSTSPSGLVQRLENKLTAMETVRGSAGRDVAKLQNEITEARSTLDQPFPRQNELERIRARARELDRELGPSSTQPPEGGSAPAAPSGGNAQNRAEPGGTYPAGTYPGGSSAAQLAGAAFPPPSNPARPQAEQAPHGADPGPPHRRGRDSGRHRGD